MSSLKSRSYPTGAAVPPLDLDPSTALLASCAGAGQSTYAMQANMIAHRVLAGRFPVHTRACSGRRQTGTPGRQQLSLLGSFFSPFVKSIASVRTTTSKIRWI